MYIYIYIIYIYISYIYISSYIYIISYICIIYYIYIHTSLRGWRPSPRKRCRLPQFWPWHILSPGHTRSTKRFPPGPSTKFQKSGPTILVFPFVVIILVQRDLARWHGDVVHGDGWFFGVPSRVELSCYIMFPTKNHALWSTITNPIVNLSTNSPRISGSSTTYGRMHRTYHILPIPIMEEAPENGCAWIKWMKWYPWFQRKNPGSRNFSHRCSSIIPDPCWNQLGDFSSHLGVGLVCIACCSRWLSLVLSCESRPPQLYWLVVYLPLLKNMSSSVGKDDIPCIMEK